MFSSVSHFYMTAQRLLYVTFALQIYLTLALPPGFIRIPCSVVSVIREREKLKLERRGFFYKVRESKASSMKIKVTKWIILRMVNIPIWDTVYVLVRTQSIVNLRILVLCICWPVARGPAPKGAATACHISSGPLLISQALFIHIYSKDIFPPEFPPWNW